MRVLLILVILVSSIHVYGQGLNRAQAIVYQYNSNNEKIGTWVYINPKTNRVETIVTYSNDSLIELISFYNENGTLNSVREFRNGRLWNVIYQYDECGKLCDVGTFKDGNGLLFIYVPYRDSICPRLYASYNYVNGIASGKTTYYYDGHIDSIRCIGNMIQTDTSKLWNYDIITLYNGDTVDSYQYMNFIGTMDGWWKFYYPRMDMLFKDGKLIEVLRYSAYDEKHGTTKHFKRKWRAKRITGNFERSMYYDYIP